MSKTRRIFFENPETGERAPYEFIFKGTLPRRNGYKEDQCRLARSYFVMNLLLEEGFRRRSEPVCADCEAGFARGSWPMGEERLRADGGGYGVCPVDPDCLRVEQAEDEAWT